MTPTEDYVTLHRALVNLSQVTHIEDHVALHQALETLPSHVTRNKD